MSAILMYHYLGSPPPKGDAHRGLTVPRREFARHLELLGAMGRRCVTGVEYSRGLADANLGGAVWITFDDGRIDNFTEAFPELAKRNLRATFFVVSDWALGGRKDCIGASALREMITAGMEIGSHSATHPRLARLPPEKLRGEIAGSKQRLEDALQTEIVSFCYPYGSWNESVVSAVRDAGYQLAVSTIRGNRNDASARWHLARAMVQPGRTSWRFRYLFSPVYQWVHERKNRRRWNNY